MRTLLARKLEILVKTVVEEHYCFAIHHAVLGAAKGEHIDTHIARDRAETDFQTCSRVGNASAVDVQKQIMPASEFGKLTDLVGSVDCSHFGGLGNRNHARLDVVLNTDSVQQRLHAFWSELPVFRGHGK